MSKFAIVIFYEGSEPAERTMRALQAALCESFVVHNVESIEMYKMSETEIVATIAGKPLEKSTANVRDNVTSPEAMAVIEISRRFGNIIVKDNCAMELMLRISLQAQKSVSISQDPALDNAICILAQPNVKEKLVFKTKKEAKMWDTAIDVIQHVYRAIYVKNV